MIRRCSRWVAVMLALMPGIASAQVFVSGAGGVFSPYEGNPGFSALVRVLAATSASEKFRIGGEIEYRSFES